MNNNRQAVIGVAAAVLAAAALSALAAGPATGSFAGGYPLRLVAAFDHQVTGVTVAPSGRIFVNFPRWTDDAPISVAELMPDGALKPYPNEQWNAYRNAMANKVSVGDHFVCVQSVVADAHGNLWVLDPGAPGNERILPNAPKIVKIDLASNTVTKVIPLPADVALQGTYLNDIRFSPDGKTGYVTDSGTRGAIIVVDLENGTSFRALDGHPSTQVDKSVIVEINGKPLRRPDGRQPAFAADGIAISADGDILYWQALTGRTLYSIDTAQLRREISEDKRSASVVEVAKTHIADGLLMSSSGVLFITSPSDSSVNRLTGNKIETVVTDKRLRWPDTMSQGPDGTVYVTASHIQDTAWFKPGAPASIKTQLFSFLPQ